jgi:hypothetical protein
MSATTDRVMAVTSVAQLLVVVFSLYFINSQLKTQNAQLQQQTDLTKAANAQTLVALDMPGNLQEVEHPEVAKLWLKGERGAKFKDDIESDQYDTLLATELTFHENVFIQCKNKLLDDEVYTAWHEDLKNLIRSQHLEDFWADAKWSYHELFRNHVDELLRAKQAGVQPLDAPNPCTMPPARTP